MTHEHKSSFLLFHFTVVVFIRSVLLWCIQKQKHNEAKQHFEEKNVTIQKKVTTIGRFIYPMEHMVHC